MRKYFAVLSAFCIFSFGIKTAEAQGILNRAKNSANNKVNQRVDEKVDKAIDKTLDSVDNPDNKSKDQDNKEPTATNSKEENAKPQSAPKSKDSVPAFAVYQNYDFIPGEKILFEDHFTDDQNGEFAVHWILDKGQAVLNQLDGSLALFLTDGNYARVNPRMKNEKYLTDPFTIEFDYYHKPGSYGPMLLLKGMDKEQGFERESGVHINNASAGFEGTGGGVSLSKDFNSTLAEGFDDHWHHVAIAYKNHQMKVYVDQFRVLVVPDTKEDYNSVTFAGIGSETDPIIFKNVRIASGGGMNMIGKKFTDAKIVTHGINFDVDKATIKPESMGTLNMIVQVMKDNPEIKFEVGGHTDNDGTAAHNLTLSQQRATAVKDQLVKMGIDASRLSTKGYGDTKPLSENNTPEGKANNRRVEFVKS